MQSKVDCARLGIGFSGAAGGGLAPGKSGLVSAKHPFWTPFSALSSPEASHYANAFDFNSSPTPATLHVPTARSQLMGGSPRGKRRSASR